MNAASSYLVVALLLMMANLACAQSRFEQRFEQMDKNQDGKLSQDEVPAKAWERMQAFDANNDGGLSREELSGARNRGKRRPGGANLAFEVKTFQASNNQSISYSLYKPKKTEGKLPLLVCLHGRGGSTHAANVAAASEIQAKHPCYVMAPGCDGRKARWVDTSFYKKDSHRSVLPELIEAIDDVVKEYPIDPNRIYLTGQSMGGVGTWGVIAKYPNKFAAAAPVCGTWTTKDAEKMKEVPIWAFHGAKDQTVPVSGSRDMIQAIQEAGGSPKYTEFPEVGHGSWGAAYATDGFWDWLFAQSLDKR